MLFAMLDMSKNIEINDGYWLRKHAVNNGIPADCVRPYRLLFNQGIGHFKGIIDSIIKSGGGSISIPLQPKHIEQYLTGYTFEYRTYCTLSTDGNQPEGFWQRDRTDRNHIIIFYNRCTSSRRQRFTQVHELMHFLQSVDPPFLDFIDELIFNSTLPENVVIKLVERLTEKSTAMFLMPNDFFLKKYEEIKTQSPIFGDAQVRQLAAIFDVSVQTATYRLEECLGASTVSQNNLGFMPP